MNKTGKRSSKRSLAKDGGRRKPKTGKQPTRTNAYDPDLLTLEEFEEDDLSDFELGDDEEIETASAGEDPSRRVIISLKKE